MSLISSWLTNTSPHQPSAAFLNLCWAETEKTFQQQPANFPRNLVNVFKIILPAAALCAIVIGATSFQGIQFKRELNQELVEMDNSLGKLEQTMSTSLWDSLNE